MELNNKKNPNESLKSAEFTSESVLEKYDEIMRDLGKFYGIEWTINRPMVKFLNTREEIDAIRGGNTDRRTVGWIDKNNNVYVLRNEQMETESAHKVRSYESYYSLIKHEVSHCFERLLAEDAKVFPKWLWEGVAIYTSGQFSMNTQKAPDGFKTFLNYFDNNGFVAGVYDESGFAVQLLIENAGKEKILELIKRLKECSDETSFNHLFVDIYGFAPDYESFNRLMHKK